MLENLLITFHVIANVLWIGSITSVGVLLATPSEKDAPAFARAARRIYLAVATPAFGASFLFGFARLSLNAAAYMHLHWFHAKLTAALAVIALHHVLGARAKRAAADRGVASQDPDKNAPRSMHDGKSSAILTVALVVCASAAVAFVLLQTQLIP